MPPDETQTTEQQTPAEPTRADLIAAAEAAAAGQPEAPEGQPLAPVEGVTNAGEPPPEGEPRWQRIIREREKGHAERQEAQNYAAEQRKAAEAERDRIIAEARESARRAAEEELAAARAKFSADPVAHLRSLGTPEEIQDAVLRAGTPEARAMQKLQEELAETKKKAATADDVAKQLADWRAEQAHEKQQARIQQTRELFLGKHATTEKAPYLNARYDQDELFWKAEQIAQSWKNAGQTFDLDDVVGYMEHEAKKRFNALQSSPQPQVPSAAPSSGIAPKVPANGPRTISASTAGERRSAPKPLAEMTPQQQRQALIEEAEEVMKAFEARK